MDNYYDSIADGYEKLHGDEQKRKVRLIKSHMKTTPNSRILDIGCGTGISSDFDCNVVGIDPSEELVKIAIKKDKNPKHKYIIEKAENLQALSFNDKEFDYVISVTAIHHVEEIEKVLFEIRRIAKKAIISVLKKSSVKDSLEKQLKNIFTIEEKVDDELDMIYFLG